MNIVKKLLSANNIYTKSDLAVIEHLVSFVFMKKVKKKELLLREGEISDRMYYVQKGLLRNYLIYDGKEINTWFVREGEFVSSISSYYYDTPSEEYIEAIEDCEVFVIKKSTYNMLMKNNLKLALFVIDELFVNLCEFQYQCQALRYLTAEKKYEFLKQKKPEILDRLSQKHIASFIGVDTTYLSKIISNYNEANK